MGNPLYINELLNGLRASAILSFDNQGGSWNFQDVDALVHRGRCATVVEYLAGRVRELPAQILEVLKVASCLGLRFDPKLASSVLSRSVAQHLELAHQVGIVSPPNHYHGSQYMHHEKGAGWNFWKFTHNSMHEAILRIVGGDREQEQSHLAIGRKLIVNLSESELQQEILTVMGHIIRGAGFITDKERVQFAHLALQATRKDFGSFESANKSIRFALSMLDNESWRNDYELTLAIYNAAAEVAYAIGDFDEVQRLVREVMRGGHNFDDKLQANLTTMYALGSASRVPESIALGLEFLKELGEEFPARPKAYHILLSFAKTKYLMRGRSDEAVLGLPMMTDCRVVSAMQIMNLLFS